MGSLGLLVLRYQTPLNDFASFGRQIPGRIHRFALTANLEVQLDAVCVAVAHLSDLLAFFNCLVFFDQQRLVMGIRRQKCIVVLQDDQVTVATQARPGVHHTAITCGDDGVTQLAVDVVTFVFDLIKACDQFALGGPYPGDIVFRGYWLVVA